jgi:hypothetical protein
MSKNREETKEGFRTAMKEEQKKLNIMITMKKVHRC